MERRAGLAVRFALYACATACACAPGQRRPASLPASAIRATVKSSARIDGNRHHRLEIDVSAPEESGELTLSLTYALPDARVAASPQAQAFATSAWLPAADPVSEGAATRLTFKRARAARSAFRIELDGVAAAWPVGSVTVRDEHGSTTTLSLGEAPPFVEPVPPLVDPAAARSARDLAVRLDEWKAARVMVAGQQLPLWRKDWEQPLVALGDDASKITVVGFAADELVERRDDQAAIVKRLSSWAESGRILDVSWYPSNPATRGGQEDRRSLPSMRDLVDTPASEGGRVFWGEFDREVVPTLRMFAERGVAVLFRPLIEGNGGWFWWGCGGRSATDTVACNREYHALYIEIQRRLERAGVHNVVWQYSFAPSGQGTSSDAVALLPRDSAGRPVVDIAGMSTYDEKVDGIAEITGLETLKSVGTVISRVALGEVGGAHVKDGRWDPQAVTDALLRANDSPDTAVSPLFARFWCDDEFEPFETLSNPSYKQLSSLKFTSGAAGAGMAWLRGFDHGVMRTGR